VVIILPTPSAPWPTYYWSFLKRFGLESYRVLIQQVLFSFAIAVVSYYISRGVDPGSAALKIALSAGLIVFAAYALFHLLRTPYLLYRETVQADPPIDVWWGFGILGISLVLGLLYGGIRLVTNVLIGSRHPTIPVEIVINPPPGPAAPLLERSDSLRRRVMRLADEVESFEIELMRDTPPNTPEGLREFNIKNQSLYVKNGLKDRTLAILQELRAKGLNIGLLDAPGAAPVRPLQDFELEELRSLAYHLDADGNVVRFY
jgi:hypothetical protein